MATPKVVAEQRRLFPERSVSCDDGHVGPFERISEVPRFYKCQSCDRTMRSCDTLAHSVFLDPTVDPYEILGGGRGTLRSPEATTPERQGWNITPIEITVVATVVLIFGVWVAVRFW